MKRHLFAAAAASTLIIAGASNAATLTDNITVSAQVNASCSFDANDIAFGTWDPLSGDAFTSSPVVVTCSPGLPYSISFDHGWYASTYDCAAPARQMYNSASDYISYGLYKDGALSQVWGCDASTDYDGTGSGSPSAIYVYASIPAAQSILDGYYQDNLVVTIGF